MAAPKPAGAQLLFSQSSKGPGMANITTKDGTHIYYKESDQELTRG
jgi:hypothetical protein